MQFTKPFWAGLADGSITMTVRRWKRRQVVAGNRYRTAGGIVEVDSIDVVEPGAISDADARRSGFADAAAMLAQLPGDPSLPLYRVAFHRIDEPDPRDVLANDSELNADAVAEILRRLARMDQAATQGPWTGATLALIAAHPEVRAPDLAELLGRQTQPFKRDVRKLKNLGLTVSLRVGYRLSPRGEAYLAWQGGD